MYLFCGAVHKFIFDHIQQHRGVRKFSFSSCFFFLVKLRIINHLPCFQQLSALLIIYFLPFCSSPTSCVFHFKWKKNFSKSHFKPFNLFFFSWTSMRKKNYAHFLINDSSKIVKPSITCIIIFFCMQIFFVSKFITSMVLENKNVNFLFTKINKSL